MRSSDGHFFSGYSFVAVALLAGALTWLVAGWFGDQSLLTAMIAVVLVGLLLASLAVIAVLLTERLTVSLLEREKRPAAAKPPRAKQPPIWRRVPQSADGTQVTSRHNRKQTDEPQRTIPFPIPGSCDVDGFRGRRKAA